MEAECGAHLLYAGTCCFRRVPLGAREHACARARACLPPHSCCLQTEKYKEAIRYYEPLVKKHWDNLLDVTAIVLANLCVSYIMTNLNEDAE
ncbi:hypothetical protein EON66_09645, partial [archaeon]